MAESKKSLNTIDERATIISDPLRAFRFRATFQPVGKDKVFNSAITSFSGGFSSIGGLSVQTQPIGYREGGYNTTAHFVPGMTTFEPLVLTRGVLHGNDGAITWMKGLFGASSGEGYKVTDHGKSSFRCNVTIQLMDHPNAVDKKNTPRMGFYVHNAWIASLNYQDLDATRGGIMYETMSLIHEGLSIAMLDSSGNPLPGSYKPAGF
jgi:phage tail-like protein